MSRFAAILVLAALTGACDSSSDVTLLGTTTPTTVPVSFDAEAVVHTSFPNAGMVFSNALTRSIDYANGLWLTVGAQSVAGGNQIWASSDGVVWEPRHVEEFGETSPVRMMALDSGGWVAITLDNAEFWDGSGSEPMKFWYSTDGHNWAESDFTVVSEATFETKAFATVGLAAVLLLEPVDAGFTLVEVAAIVIYTTDGGASWNEVPLGGDPQTVASLGGDLFVGGSTNLKPTLWRLSTGWQPEPVAGLGEFDSAVMELVEGFDGRALLAAGIPNIVGMTWFRSEDLRSWEETTPPGDFSNRSSVYRRGPLMVADLGVLCWISTDGVFWTKLDLRELPDRSVAWHVDGALFVAAGATIIGATSMGLISDHPMVFTGPERPGAWEELVRLPHSVRLSSPGTELYLVHQGTVQVLREGKLIPLPSPPVVIPDEAQVQATESAVFVTVDDRAWVFRNDEWASSDLPKTETWSGVVERDGEFMVLRVESGEVRKYVSKDGARWVAKPIPAIAADVVYLHAGRFLAHKTPTLELLGDYDMETQMAAYDAIEFMVSENGEEWMSSTYGETSFEVEVSDGWVVVPNLDDDLLFPIPEDAAFREVVSWSEGGVILRVVKGGVPHLVAVTRDGAELWVPQEVAGPLIGSVWFDGTTLYGSAYPEWGYFGDSGSEETVIYVWNPDAE